MRTKRRKIRIRIVSKAKNAILAELVDRCGSIKKAADLIGVCNTTFGSWMNFRSAPKLMAPVGEARRGGGLSSERLKQVVLALERETGKNVSEIFSMTKSEMGLFRDTRIVTKEIEPSRLIEHMAERREISYEPDLVGRMQNEELKAAIGEVLKTLSYQEREILKLRFGLDGGFAHTLAEVGHVFKVTQERIRQVEAKAVRKLQQPSRSGMLIDHI